jgi:hypothetical protein
MNYKCCSLLVDLYINEIVEYADYYEWLFDFEIYGNKTFYIFY